MADLTLQRVLRTVAVALADRGIRVEDRTTILAEIEDDLTVYLDGEH